MTRAGFWAIESHSIRFGRDGRWYSDDEPIINPRIQRLFSQHIRPDEGGGWQLVIGDEKASIIVEDTPYVVQRVDGSPETGFSIELNDGERESLPASSLQIGEKNVLYCNVKQEGFRARFLRPAQAELLAHVTEVNGDLALPLPAGESVVLGVITPEPRP